MRAGELDPTRPTQRAGLGWLVVGAPLDARTFTTTDEHVAGLLRAAALPCDSSTPDVEVAADPGAVRGVAPRVVTWCGIPPTSGPWAVRRATRVLRSLRLRLAVSRAARRLRRGGYRVDVPATWESGAEARRRRVPDRRPRLALADALAENLVLVADRGRLRASVLEGALGRAGEAAGRPLEVETVLIRDTSVVVLGDTAVLRIELGGADSGVLRQVGALGWLQTHVTSDAVDTRAPRLLAHGDAGPGVWSLEERFTGRPPPAPLPDAVLSQVVDFLGALAASWSGAVDGTLLEEEAELAARACSTAGDVGAVGAWARSRVAESRGVVAHGDLFHGNLLVDRDVLTGVVDWERLGIGRPALHDIVHLRIAERAASARTTYGRAMVRWADERASGPGSDGPLTELASRANASSDTEALVAVASLCWLAHVAHQLRRVPGASASWVAENVERPAFELRRLTARARVAPGRR